LRHYTSVISCARCFRHGYERSIPAAAWSDCSPRVLAKVPKQKVVAVEQTLARVDQPASIAGQMQLLKSAPVLDISDGHGELLPDAIFRVLATLFHPDSPEERQHAVEALDRKAQFDALDAVPKDLATLSQEVDAQSEDTMMHLADGS
jgi:hypothetical protein